MIPLGAEPFTSKIGGEFSVTLNESGVYGIRCAPRHAPGMVAPIVVGTPENVEAAKAVTAPPDAQKVFADLSVQLGGASQ